jgi:hypothetical protein
MHFRIGAGGNTFNSMKTFLILVVLNFAIQLHSYSQIDVLKSPSNVGWRYLADAERLVHDFRGKIDSLTYLKAEATFTLAILNGVHDGLVFLQRGICRANTGNFSSAIEDFNVSASLEEGNVFMRDSCYSKVGDGYALDLNKMYLMFDPSYIYLYRGICRLALKDLDLACNDFSISDRMNNDKVKKYIHDYCEESKEEIKN